MVAALLRTDIGEVLVIHSTLVLSDELRTVAVAVVLVRTTAIVLHMVVLLRHLQLNAIAEQPLVLGLALRLQLLAYDDRAVSLQCVGHRELALHARHVYLCDNTIAAYRQFLHLHLGLLPCGKTQLQAGTVVVVRWGTPELGSDALTVNKHRLSVDVEIVNQARLLADGQRSTLRRELHITLGLLLLHIALVQLLGLQLIEDIGLHHKLLAFTTLELEVDENLACMI